MGRVCGCGSWKEEYDPTDKIQAVRRLMESHAKGDVLTGVFYLNANAPTFIDMLNVTDQPLGTLPESLTRPSREALAKCMADLQ
jgi:2-oxoglutarate ferredoxin oxidoreductase subunit beta